MSCLWPRVMCLESPLPTWYHHLLPLAFYVLLQKSPSPAPFLNISPSPSLSDFLHLKLHPISKFTYLFIVCIPQQTVSSVRTGKVPSGPLCPWHLALVLCLHECMCEFPIPAVMDNHKLNALKQHSFINCLGSEVQGQCGWLSCALCSGHPKSKIKVSTMMGSNQGLWGSAYFQARSGCWPCLVPWGCRTDISSWLVIGQGWFCS